MFKYKLSFGDLVSYENLSTRINDKIISKCYNFVSLNKISIEKAMAKLRSMNSDQIDRLLSSKMGYGLSLDTLNSALELSKQTFDLFNTRARPLVEKYMRLTASDIINETDKFISVDDEGANGDWDFAVDTNKVRVTPPGLENVLDKSQLISKTGTYKELGYTGKDLYKLFDAWLLFTGTGTSHVKQYLDYIDKVNSAALKVAIEVAISTSGSSKNRDDIKSDIIENGDQLEYISPYAFGALHAWWMSILGIPTLKIIDNSIIPRLSLVLGKM